MSHRALVIEDDQPIAEEVTAILVSLGHEHDLAADQETARRRIAAGGYDYVLLDLEIPIQEGRGFPRVQNGINLLDEIRASARMRQTPVIVMSCHGTDGPDLAVEVMRKGAIDYVKKPFPKVGRTLDEAIKGVLTPVQKTEPAAAAPKPFEGGEMVFYPDRVELCGVTVLSDARAGTMRAILEVLRQSKDGNYRALGGEALAKRIGCIAGQNGVAGCIRDFRRHVSEVLREVGLEARQQDVIRSGGPGYRLNRWITVRDGK